jgi:hypothetical protein|tara:strand:- start:401 stop:601 length:201 start_codon:yes stop_codon:yes gene_type:complete
LENKLKKIVNDKPVWDALVATLNEKISNVHRKLEQETTMEAMYRAQGEIMALRRLTFLRDEVNGPK